MATQIDPEPDAPDRILGVLPLFHVFANICVLNRTVVGGGEMNFATSSDASIVSSDGASESRSSRSVTIVPVSTGNDWRQLLSVVVARAAWMTAFTSMTV